MSKQLTWSDNNVATTAKYEYRIKQLGPYYTLYTTYKADGVSMPSSHASLAEAKAAANTHCKQTKEISDE